MAELLGVRGWIVVRRARESDLPAVERIEMSSFHRKVAYSRRRLLGLVRGLCFVAVVGGVPVGYVAVRRRGRGSYIASLAVRGDVRGLGLGERLVRKALSLATKSGSLYCALHVSTSKSGRPAYYLYRKLGFFHVAARKKWYDNGDDALYMVKEL